MSGSVKKLGQSGPIRTLVDLWRRHPKIAQFITYFLVGNLATLVQVVLIPVLQPVFGPPGWWTWTCTCSGPSATRRLSPP